MKNSNVLNVGKLHNSDISIGSCEILTNQVKKISKALSRLDKFYSHSDDFDDLCYKFLIAQINNSLEIINCVVDINLNNFFHE